VGKGHRRRGRANPSGKRQSRGGPRVKEAVKGESNPEDEGEEAPGLGRLRLNKGEEEGTQLFISNVKSFDREKLRTLLCCFGDCTLRVGFVPYQSRDDALDALEHPPAIDGRRVRLEMSAKNKQGGSSFVPAPPLKKRPRTECPSTTPAKPSPEKRIGAPFGPDPAKGPKEPALPPPAHLLSATSGCGRFCKIDGVCKRCKFIDFQDGCHKGDSCDFCHSTDQDGSGARAQQRNRTVGAPQPKAEAKPKATAKITPKAKMTPKPKSRAHRQDRDVRQGAQTSQASKEEVLSDCEDEVGSHLHLLKWS